MILSKMSKCHLVYCALVSKWWYMVASRVFWEAVDDVWRVFEVLGSLKDGATVCLLIVL